MNDILDKCAPQISRIIKNELSRQRNCLELIASENFTSEAVMAASASVMCNKYAEGYPGRRYYGGCEFMDEMENLAISQVKKLFKAEDHHVNVQAHSGSQANMASYLAVMKPGDSLLGMDLAHGGHLTHGSPVSFSGRLFKVYSYGVRRDNELLDYDDMLLKAKIIKPKVIMAGASAYPQAFDFAKFREAADIAGACLIVDIAHYAGLIAAGLYPSPVGYADIITSTTHKTLRGPRGGLIICKPELAKAINAQIFPGIQGGPLMHSIAAKAVAFGEALSPEFVEYQSQVIKNAKRMAEKLSSFGFRIVSGGTESHMILMDLQGKNLTGKDAEIALDIAGITTNKNSIPFDPQPPMITSGLRVGTAAITTRGMKEAEIDEVCSFINEALAVINDESKLKEIAAKVKSFCDKFPLYPNMK